MTDTKLDRESDKGRQKIEERETQKEIGGGGRRE